MQVVDYKIAAPLSDSPAPYKIGLIVLSSDMIVERDFAMMSPPGGEVACYVSRVEFVVPTTEANLRLMGPQLANAAALILPTSKLDVIAYCCTSASVLIGTDEVEAQVRKGRPGVSVATPISAAVSAFAELGVRRISLLTPYTGDITQKMAAFIEARGIEVANASFLNLLDDQEMARIAPDQIVEAGLTAAHPEAEALFVSCTGIRSVEAITRLEQELGKPVLCSNQCLFWSSLRTAGYARPIAGFGRLLAR